MEQLAEAEKKEKTSVIAKHDGKSTVSDYKTDAPELK